MTLEELREKLDALPPGGKNRKKTFSQEQIDLMVAYSETKQIADVANIFGISKETLYKIRREELRRRKEHAGK